MAELEESGKSRVAPGERGIEQSFGRASDVLDALARVPETGLRFTDIVDATGFSKATVHRLLVGLARHGFVDMDRETDRFFLGFRLAVWGAATRNRQGLAVCAEPFLKRLAQETGDTVYLSLRAGCMSHCVSRYEGPFPIRALPLTPGDKNALGVGSGSLAILAFIQSDEEIDRIIADPEHRAARDRRSVSEKTIRELVATSRRNGFALADNLTPGMRGVGIPLHGRDGRPIASVSIATISERLRQPRLQEVIGHIRDAVHDIEYAMAESRV